MRLRVAFALASLLVASVAGGQEPRLIASQPATELPHEFTRISGVFELRDGRLVVVDEGHATVFLADYERREATPLGRRGSGPGEYRAPRFLYPLGDDSVGVLDDAAARLLVITRDGRVGGFVSPRAAQPLQYGGLPPAARTGDGRGFFYGEGSALQRGRDGSLQVVDSAPIVRWQPPVGAPEIIGYVPRPRVAGSRAAAGMVVVAPGTTEPAPRTRALWAVGSDGTVAIVQPEPYLVRLKRPSEGWLSGSAIPFRRVTMNDSVKRAYLSERTSGETVVFNRQTGATSIQRGSHPRPEPAVWAREVPPFLSNAMVAFSPDGVLWIQRTTFGREGARYDLIGSRGQLVDRVRLPEGHRVVGFGRASMYVVRRDADDLEYLQRHPGPTPR